MLFFRILSRNLPFVVCSNVLSRQMKRTALVVSCLASLPEVRYIVGLNTRQVKPKTIKLVFFGSLLSTQYEGIRVRTGWFEIGSGANYGLFVQCAIQLPVGILV